MKLDDRFMTILTALLLIVGIGAIMHRGEDGSSLFSGPGKYKPEPDSFTVRAGRVQALDVLLNDRGVESVNRNELAIVQPPKCGSAEPVDGLIEYVSETSCEGAIVLSYCVPFEGNCSVVPVTLTVVAVKQDGSAEGAPVVVDLVRQGAAPQEQPQIAMAQPMRLSLPTNSEVITPAEAAEDVRRIGMDTGPAVVADDTGDARVNVSTASARSGAVDVTGITLAAPEIEDSPTAMAMAAPTTAPSAPRSPAAPPSALASPGLSQPDTGNDLPTGFSAPATELALAMPQPDPSPRPAPPAAVAAPEPTAAAPQPAPSQPAPVQPAPNPVPAVTPAATDAPQPTGTEVVVAESTADLPAPAIETDSGLFASIARSNTVFGVTLNAARSMFAPSAALVRPVPAPAGPAAPRPQEIGVVPVLDGAALEDIVTTSAGINPSTERAPRSAGRPEGLVVASISPESFVAPAAPKPFALTEANRPAVRPEAVANAPSVAPQAAPATGTEVAALPPQTDAVPPVVAPADPVASCGIDMTLQVRAGAEIVATLYSPCRPGLPFVVDHAGLRFTAVTGADGVANFVVPAMLSQATVSATFADGAAALAQTEVENMSRMTRVAITWTGDLDFDLHAYEFGAADDSAGHVSARNPGDYREARRGGGGYLTVLGADIPGATKSEVYTLFQSTRTADGVVDVDVRLAGKPAECPGTMVLKTLRSEGAELVASRDTQITLGDCSASQAVVVDSALYDVRVSRN